MTTPDQAERIRGHVASLMHAIRPDFDIAGCITALRRAPAALTIGQVTIAAIRYAEDQANTTPAHLFDFGNRAWDSDWYLPCKTHPEQRARRDGECASCWADRNGTDTPLPIERPGVPPKTPLRELITDRRAATTTGATP